MHGCWFGNAFGWGGGSAEILLLLAVIVLIVCWAVGIFRRKPVNPDYRDSLAILKRRLASGEITLEEYEAVKKVL